MKLTKLPVLLILCVIAPAVAAWVCMAAIGGAVGLYAQYFHSLYGNMPLPAITDLVLGMVEGAPVPFQWIGFGAMLVMFAIAIVTDYTSSSSEIAWKRLVVLAAMEWMLCLSFAGICALAIETPHYFNDAIALEGKQNLDFEVTHRFLAPVAKLGPPIVYQAVRPIPASLLPHMRIPSGGTMQLHGYEFYEQPIKISAADAAKLQSLISYASGHSEWRGLNQTVRNRPKFELQWRDGSGHLYEAMFFVVRCEVKLYGPGVDTDCMAFGPGYDGFGGVIENYFYDFP